MTNADQHVEKMEASNNADNFLSLVICYKVKWAFATWSETHTPRNLTKRYESIYLHKDPQKNVKEMYMNIYSAFIPKWETLEQPKCPSAGE